MSEHENTTIKHLDCDPFHVIDRIGLHLDENVYGANGEKNEEEIRADLIEDIRMATDHWADDAIPVGAVASLLWSLWQYKDRQHMDELAAAGHR